VAIVSAPVIAAACRTQQSGIRKPVSANMLANGHDKPSMRAMQLIARACGVEPDYFAEYRLAAARRELDPAEVGLEQAVANFNARLGAQRAAGAKERPLPQPRVQPRPTS
jgi:transcriptional regulator with XRE-family HTH domain